VEAPLHACLDAVVAEHLAHAPGSARKFTFIRLVIFPSPKPSSGTPSES
jgi:hypothetical protein